MSRQKPIAIDVMKRAKTTHPEFPTVVLLLVSVLLLVALMAFNKGEQSAFAPVELSTTASAQITLDQLQQAKLDAAIAQAKTEVIGANNSTMGVLVTAITGFTTLLLGGFAFVTYKQAANAAKNEIRDVRAEIDTLLDKAKSAVKAIQSNQQTSDEITADLKARYNSLPSENSEPLPASEQTELANAVAVAEATPRAQRTAQQFRQLMLAAKQAGDWEAYREHANAMAYLFADTPEDLAFAMFARAFANTQLGDHAAAAAGYADYLTNCPDIGASKRASAFYNWGTALSKQARTRTGTAADALWVQAGEKFLEAVRIKPDKHEAFNNWGSALNDQALTKIGAEADALWAQAGKNFSEAVRIKPDKHEAFNNWGIVLSSQAYTSTGTASDELWTLAIEKFSEAVRLKADYRPAFHNWGLALAKQAEAKSGSEKNRLLKLAAAKRRRAATLSKAEA